MYVFVLLLGASFGYSNNNFQLEGQVDDCSCSVDTVDQFNNVKIYPRLRSLLTKDYFRFYKVNLKRKCPFWHDDSHCAMKYCHVEPCDEHTIPIGLKKTAKAQKDFEDKGHEKVIYCASKYYYYNKINGIFSVFRGKQQRRVRQ